jgi:ribosomal protein S18 acetylase RimI-like enzyme
MIGIGRFAIQKGDNASAIACYEGLGFEKVASYGEYMLELKR